MSRALAHTFTGCCDSKTGLALIAMKMYEREVQAILLWILLTMFSEDNFIKQAYTAIWPLSIIRSRRSSQKDAKSKFRKIQAFYGNDVDFNCYIVRIL